MLHRCCLIVALISSFTAFTVAERTIDLKEIVGPSVSQTQSTFALVDRTLSELQIFRSADDATPLSKSPTGAGARAIIWKQMDNKGCYVVICTDAIYVHDDVTAQQIGTVELKEGPAYRLAADPRASSPLVYYSLERSAQGNRFFGRLNLKSMKDEGCLESEGIVHLSTPIDLRISPDGNTLYAWRPRTSPTGVFRLQISEPAVPGQQPRLLQLRYDHDDWRELVIDPAGRFVASWNEIRPADATKPTGRLSGSPLCALNQRPVLFVLNGSQMDAISSNDFRSLGSVDLLPLIKFKPDPRRRQQPEQFEVVNGNAWREDNKVVIAEPDERGGRLIVRMRTSLFEIPLSAFKLPDEPFVAGRISGSADALAGVTWTGEAKPFDPRAKLALASGPEGATFRDGKLTWKPTEAQVGSQQFQFESVWEKTTLKQTLDVLVRRPSVKLPYRATFFSLSPDGSKTLLGRPGADDRMGRSYRGQDSPKQPQLLILDNNTLAILAQRELPEQIASVAVDNERVYVALRDVAAIKVLSAKDLSEQRQVFTKAVAIQMNVVGNLLNVQSGADNTSEWLTLPDLKPITLGDQREFSRGGGVMLVEDKLLYGGTEYDAKTLKPRGLLERGTTIGFGDVGVRQSDGGAFIRTYFGAYAANGRIARLSKSSINIADQSNSLATVLPDVPAFAAVSMQQTGQANDASPRYKVALAIRDLVSGATLSSFLLSDEPRWEHQGSSLNESCRIEAAPGKLIVLMLDRLYPVDTSSFAKLNPPMPLLLKEKDLPKVISGSPGTLSWELVSGKAQVKMDLLNAPPGVTVADTKPVVTVDPKTFAKEAAPGLWQGISQRGGVPGTPAQRLQTYAERERKRLNDLLGLSLKQVPVSVAIKLRVTDADNQTAEATQIVLLDLPESAFKDVIEQASRQETPQRSRDGNAGGDSALQRRVEELERENEKLRAQVEVLRDLVGNKAPATRPSR